MPIGRSRGEPRGHSRLHFDRRIGFKGYRPRAVLDDENPRNPLPRRLDRTVSHVFNVRNGRLMVQSPLIPGRTEEGFPVLQKNSRSASGLIRFRYQPPGGEYAGMGAGSMCIS